MMKAMLCTLLACAVLFCACEGSAPSKQPTVTKSTTATKTSPTTIVTEPTIPAPDVLLSLDGIALDGVFGWFKEVCLDTEYRYDGDASVVQKWTTPLFYTVKGNPTDEDLAFLEQVCDMLNTISGFPGMDPAEKAYLANVEIYFCSGDELVQTLGDPFTPDLYGGTRFWYDNNEIYRSIICCRDDIDQATRNTVIIEEIYNQLGPMQDTATRSDSVIYQYSNENDTMSPIDVLVLQLLYHPAIECGMTEEACERVIADLLDEQTAWLAEQT